MAGDELFVVHDPEGAAAAAPQPLRTFVGARGDDVLMAVAVHVHDGHRARAGELERDGSERRIAEPAGSDWDTTTPVQLGPPPRSPPRGVTATRGAAPIPTALSNTAATSAAVRRVHGDRTPRWLRSVIYSSALRLDEDVASAFAAAFALAP